MVTITQHSPQSSHLYAPVNGVLGRTLTKLAIVRPLSGRYSNLEPTQPWVAEITVRPIQKAGGWPG